MQLSSCSSLFTSKVLQGDFYTLQAIPEELVSRSILESVIFKNKQTQKLLTQVEYYEQSLNMVAMTYSGLPIIQAKWHQNLGLTELVSAQFNEDLVLQFIRDIQWVKWPIHSIENGLSDNYLIIEFLENGNKVREIKHEERVFVKVTYTQKGVILENKAEQYELVIEQLNDK